MKGSTLTFLRNTSKHTPQKIRSKAQNTLLPVSCTSTARVFHGLTATSNTYRTTNPWLCRSPPPALRCLCRRAMRLDSLPSPLNVPQELVSYLFWRHKERAKELFARAVFWLVSGPIAISATAILWALSVPLTLAWTARVVRSSGSTMLVPALLGICFNLGLAPLLTAWLWLGGVAGVWQQGHGTTEVG